MLRQLTGLVMKMPKSIGERDKEPFSHIHGHRFHPGVIRVAWIVHVRFVQFVSVGEQPRDDTLIDRLTSRFLLKFPFDRFRDVFARIDHALRIANRTRCEEEERRCLTPGIAHCLVSRL